MEYLTAIGLAGGRRTGGSMGCCGGTSNDRSVLMTLMLAIVMLSVFPAGVLYLAFKPDLEYWQLVAWLGLALLLTTLVVAVCWVLVIDSIISQSRQIVELFCALSLAIGSMFG